MPSDTAPPPPSARLLALTARIVSAHVGRNPVTAERLPELIRGVHRALGGSGAFMPMPRVEEVTDLDDGRPYPVITGEYSTTPAWAFTEVPVGAPVDKPTPIFTKLDDAVVEEELTRLRGEEG